MSQSPENTGRTEPTEGRLELALSASNEGIWDWWTGTPEIYYSRRILEFLECGQQNAPNFFLPPHDTIHADDQDRFASALNIVLDPAGPELFAVDCRVQTGQDAWRWLRIRGTVVRDRDGAATRIAGSMIDISRRKSAEAQIEEERHLLRMLIDHVPLQVYFKDRESKFVLTNHQMAQWMGLENPDDLVGKHDRDFFQGEHSDEAVEDENDIMSTGESVTGKLERETWHAGGDTWVQTSKFPWRDRHGHIKGTFGVSSDVTKLVEAQHEADALAQELAVRNQTYEEEVQLAREIQQALAGSQFPEIGNDRHRISFAARYLPISGLAGDFFEIVRISDETAGMLICDVMGHGVRAALVVAMLRGLVEKQRKSASDPAAYLQGLNSGLASILERAGVTIFATAFYAVVDLGNEVLRYATAGHPGGLAIKPGSVRQLATEKHEQGPGLGLLPNARFPAAELPLADISSLLLFTDGILEAENEAGQPFLEDRLIDLVAARNDQAMEKTLDELLATVLDYADGHHFDDDVCLLAMEKTASL